MLEVSAELENSVDIGQFLKLLQRMIHAPRDVHKPSLDYSQSQILTSK